MIPALTPPWRITPQGDRTLLLIRDEPVSVQGGQACAAIATALRQSDIRGITDIVPTFNSVAVHYQPRLFGSSTTFQKLASEVAGAVNQHASQAATTQAETRCIDIPVCYGGEYGPDLSDVAQHCGISEHDVIALHSQEPTYVFMLGFAPGAPYIGMHDPALDIGRRDTPRTVVPAGSVAIANRQSIIYPNTSPGGWHVIGATPVTLFFPDRDPPTLLAPGDSVRFVPISADEFAAHKERSMTS